MQVLTDMLTSPDRCIKIGKSASNFSSFIMQKLLCTMYMYTLDLYHFFYFTLFTYSTQFPHNHCLLVYSPLSSCHLYNIRYDITDYNKYLHLRRIIKIDKKEKARCLVGIVEIWWGQDNEQSTVPSRIIIRSRTFTNFLELCSITKFL